MLVVRVSLNKKMPGILLEFFQWLADTLGVQTVQMTYLGVARSLVALIFFTYLGYEDLKNRRIDRNNISIGGFDIQLTWHPILLVSIGFLIWELSKINPAFYKFVLTRIGLNIIIATVVGIGLHKIHKIPGLSDRWRLFGAADMKAFLVLGILVPTYPFAGVFPIFRSPPYILRLFSLGVIQWTAFVGIFYILGFGIFTVYKSYSSGSGFKFPESLLGYQTTPEKLHEATNRRVMHEHGELTFNGLQAEMVKDYLDWRNSPNTNITPVDDITDVERVYLAQFLRESEWGPSNVDELLEDDGYEEQIERAEEYFLEVGDSDSIWVLHDIPFVTLMAAGVWLTIIIGDPLFTLIVLLS